MRRNRESSITRKSTDDLRQDLSKLKSQLSSSAVVAAAPRNKSASLTNLKSAAVYYGGQENPTKRKAADVLIAQRQRGRSSVNVTHQHDNPGTYHRVPSTALGFETRTTDQRVPTSRHFTNERNFNTLAAAGNSTRGGGAAGIYTALEGLRDPKSFSTSPAATAKEPQPTQREELDEKAMLETRTPTYSEKKLSKLQEDNEHLFHDLNKLMASIEDSNSGTAREQPVQDFAKNSVIPSQEEELKRLLKEYAAKGQSPPQNGYSSPPVGMMNGGVGNKAEFQQSLEEVSLLKNEVNNLKKSLAKSENEKNQYSNQLEVTLSEYQLETDSLKRDLKLKTDQCNLAEQKVKDLLEQNSWLTKEQIRLRNESRSYESVAEESSKMSGQITDLLQKVDSLTEQRDILAMKCENLEAENEMLVKASEEHEQIRNDQKLAQREIQKRADEIDQLEKAQEESSKEHAQSMHNLQDALKDLKHNYQQQSIKYNDLLHEFNRLKSVVTESPPHSGGSSGSPQTGPTAKHGPAAAADTQLFPPSPGATGPNATQAVQTYGGPDIPTEPVPVTVFIAKYTYDPLKYSPNESPELELSVTKGDYVYIHGDMDDDGFFEGELLSGHRGLVPSNFVEPVNEKELPDLLKSHLQKLRNRSLSNLHLNQIAQGNYCLNPKVDSGVQVLEDDITEFPNRVMNSHRGDLPLFHPSPNTNSSSPFHNHILSSPKSAAAAAAALNASVPPKFSPTHYASSAATANHNPSNLSPNQMGGVYNSPEGVNKYSPSLAHSSPRSSVGGAGEDLKHVTNGPSKQLSPKNDKSSTQQNSVGGVEEVAPPQKIVVEKMLLNSVLISWSPSSENVKKVDCYEIFIDGIKHTSVKPYAKLRALLHNIDTNEAHKVSIRTVTTRGCSSREQQCSVVVGKGARQAPYDVKAVNILCSSADVVWWPSNSNLAHAITVNQGEEVRVPAGEFKWSLTGLTPSSVYKVSIRPLLGGESTPEDPSSSTDPSPVSKIEFKTLPGDHDPEFGGTPDCPSDVRIQQGSQPGTVAVSWKPVVDASMGHTSNGAFLTGYEIVRDSGEVIATVSDPVLDRVILSTSSLRGAKRISVRTTSYNGASIDSRPVRIPSSLSNSPRNEPLGPSRLAPQGHVFSPSKLNNHHQLSPGGSHKLGAAYPLSPTNSRGGGGGELDLHPDFISETSDTSELSDILEEGPFAAAHRGGGATTNMRPSNFPDFSLENVAVPSTMPSVYDYQQYLKEPGPLNERSKKSRPRIPHPHSQIHANEKAYTSDSELSHGRLSRRGMKQGHPSLMAPGGYRDDHLVLYESSPSRVMGPGSRGGSRNGSRFEERGDTMGGRPGAGRGKRMSQRHRYFVALYNYNPATMSPNKDSAHEEIAFREADVIKVYGDKDEDDFYYGETRGGQRGFVPSNMVMVLSHHNAGGGGSASSNSRLRDRASVSSLRKMVALFDYDPIKTSPNPDAEDVELSFRAGDLMYIFGQVDEDGFYVAELQSGQRGLVPSNFLEEVDDAKFVTPRGPRAATNSSRGQKGVNSATDPYSQSSPMPSKPIKGISGMHRTLNGPRRDIKGLNGGGGGSILPPSPLANNHHSVHSPPIIPASPQRPPKDIPPPAPTPTPTVRDHALSLFNAAVTSISPYTGGQSNGQPPSAPPTTPGGGGGGPVPGFGVGVSIPLAAGGVAPPAIPSRSPFHVFGGSHRR